MTHFSNADLGNGIKMSFTPKGLGVEVPKLGDPTVAFLNRALQYARQHEMWKQKRIELFNFERDVKTLNQYVNCQDNTALQDTLYDEMLIKNSKIYERAYLKAVQIFSSVAEESII
jgi:hypothetical protein